MPNSRYDVVIDGVHQDRMPGDLFPACSRGTAETIVVKASKELRCGNNMMISDDDCAVNCGQSILSDEGLKCHRADTIVATSKHCKGRIGTCSMLEGREEDAKRVVHHLVSGARHPFLYTMAEVVLRQSAKIATAVGG